MPCISFDAIREHQCAFVDVTTLILVSTFRDTFFEWRLCSKKDVNQLAALESLNRDFGPALEAFERMAAYEFLVVDEYALNHSKVQLPATDLLRPVSIPHHVYDATLRIMADNSLGELAEKYEREQHWDVTGDKPIFDYLSKSTSLDAISRSDQSAARVLFYLQLASIAGVPVFLNPKKDEFLKLYEAEFSVDVLKWVQATVDKAIGRAFAEITGTSHELALPPLIEYMLRYAVRKKTTIFEALCDIRDKKPAKAFRAWLWDIQQLLLSGDRPAWVQAARKMADFKKVVDSWAKTFDVGTGVKSRRLCIKIGLPSKILGMSLTGADVTLSIRDPIIFGRPLYLSFVSSWYEA